MPKKLLKLLTENPRLSNVVLGKILNKTPSQIETAIQKLQQSGELIGFQTILNSNQKNTVRAIVEVRLQTVRGKGFDETAERIARFPEVENVYLISGSHDLSITVNGPNLNFIAEFISQRIATLENIRGTTTQFLLKKYKENNLIFKPKEQSPRLKVSA